jgi:LmbE family N-acetylglucosaminyl deacetylase
MSHDSALPTRKEFLLAITGAALLPQMLEAQPRPGKLLIVVAHPDDEYECAATTYHLVRELGWTADQLIVTNGESGYRYSTLAEVIYGTNLTREPDGREHLAAIRKQEAARAGKILGIRQHYFLDQKDLGFDTDASSAGTSNWDRPRVRAVLDGLLAREQYDAIFTLLPTAETHGHHRAATELALEAVATMPERSRPPIFGADARSKADTPVKFRGAAPLFTFDRATHFGFRNGLSYQIVVNWVIAEHKSQGLFQTESGKSDSEQFWLYEENGPDAARRVQTGPLGGLL